MVHSAVGCGRHTNVHDPPPLVCENEKNVEYLKSNGGGGKEVDGHQGADVVLEKPAPGLGGRTPSANQMTLLSAISIPSLNWPMDSRSAPRPVLPTVVLGNITMCR
jgi:hypothetical protein